MEFDFRVTSGKVHLTDPCYEVDMSSRYGAYNVPARNGDWHVEVEHINSWGFRVKRWRAYHIEENKVNQLNCLSNVLYDNDFGVDSGQFGIFDSEIYDGDSEYDQPGFYRDCCDITLARDLCGVVSKRGFVSSSGFGDGCYDGYASYNANGELIKFVIDFIDENENDNARLFEEDED